MRLPVRRGLCRLVFNMSRRLILCLVLLVSCRHELPAGPDARRDGSSDQRLTDVRRGPDAPVDADRREGAARDRSRADLPMDSHNTRDQPDGPSVSGCVGSNQILLTSQSGLLLASCESASGGVVQCTAINWCATGWHVCLMSEYNDVFPNGAPPNAEGAWLAGCLWQADGDAGIAGNCSSLILMNSACSQCSQVCPACSSSMPVASSCKTGGPWSTDCRFIGLVSASGATCYTVGPTMQGYWTPTPSQVPKTRVLCCSTK